MSDDDPLTPSDDARELARTLIGMTRAEGLKRIAEHGLVGQESAKGGVEDAMFNPDRIRITVTDGHITSARLG
ncbi:MAG: hypothetical protein JWN95_1842 [Frankiales bacterium]|nr:hypothetical protein [Frankiales bacterium]